MTTAPVRAPAPAVTRPEPVRPPVLVWPPRPRPRIAGVAVGQIVTWQAATLLALVATGRPAGPAFLLGIVAVAVVVATAWRSDGRWAHEWVWLWLCLRARRHRGRSGRHLPPDLAVLAIAGRTEAVRDVEIDGRGVAMIGHAHGWTAVLEFAADGVPGAAPWLPFTLAPPADSDTPPATAQLIVHTVPVGTGRTYARTWLAVQVRRDGGHSDGQLRAALAGALRRVLRQLRRDGLDARALDRAGLRNALASLTRLELAGPAASRTTGAFGVGTEQWRAWWTGTVPQACVRIRSWPGLPAPPGPELFHALLDPRPVQTVSIASRRLRSPVARDVPRAGEDALAGEVVVRLAERDPARLEAAVRHLCDRLTATGAWVERLDGRHLPGLAATLPLGGFLPIGGAGCAPDRSGSTTPTARQRRAAPRPPTPPNRPPSPRPGHGVARIAALPTELDRLAARARIPPREAQVVSFIAARGGAGSTTTATGVALTMATLRPDHTALLDAHAATATHLTAAIHDLRQDHAFVLVDLGTAGGDLAGQAVAASTRIVVVTGADRPGARATRLGLDLIQRVRPGLLADAVVAVVCRSPRQYRRVLRRLDGDTSSEAARIIPVPFEPACQVTQHLDLTRLLAPTRQAYLRVAAALADAPPAAAVGRTAVAKEWP